MPIASHAPVVPVQSPVRTPTIEPEHYQSIVVDTLVTPAHALTAYVEGAPWSVDYFSQIVSRDNDLREVDVVSPNVYQQYKKITSMEIRVTSDLSSNYNEEQATMQVSGSATMYGTVIPKKADYFIAQGFRGRTAIFVIISAERLTHNSESVYNIDYTMVGYHDTQPAIYQALNEKTVQTYVFVKDRLISGVSPLVRESLKDFVFRLDLEFTKLARFYVDAFYAPECSNIIAPGQDSRIYDHALMSYITKIISPSKVDKLNYCRLLTSDNEYFINQPLIWSAMLTREARDLSSISEKIQVVPKNMFLKMSYGRGIPYNNMENYVYPLDVDTSRVTSDRHNPKIGFTKAESFRETTNRAGALASVYTNNYTEDEGAFVVPTIHPALRDDYYVFSASFYNDLADKSLLELVCLDYLNRRPIKPERMQHILNTIYTWPRLEQYYYIPVVLTLIQQIKAQEY